MWAGLSPGSECGEEREGGARRERRERSQREEVEPSEGAGTDGCPAGAAVALAFGLLPDHSDYCQIMSSRMKMKGTAAVWASWMLIMARALPEA